MLSLLILVAVVVLLALHEVLVARFNSGRPASRVVRPVLLLAAVGLAVVFGARTEFLARVRSALQGMRASPVAFEPGGDSLLRHAMEAQQPERPFPIGGTPEAVQSWQAHIVNTLRTRADFVPGASTPVPTRVLQTEELGEVRRTFIEFTSWDGTRIPAYVHQPSGGRSLGGVLVIPGHGSGIRATAGIGPVDYQYAVALELARGGYVTLTPELRGFGLLAPNGVRAHRAVAHAALVSGSFYKASVVRDLSLALTVLQTWEGVDPSRLAVAGTSLGGELAVFLAVLDPRPRVIISHSYGGGIGPESVDASVAHDDARQTPHGCHTIPGINRILRREDWFRLLAPRAVQVVRGTENVSQHVDAFSKSVTPAFDQLDAATRFEFSVQRGEHEFFLEPATRFLARWL